MNRHHDYTISFSSFPVGVHRFDFELTDAFFEHFPDRDFTQPVLKAEVLLVKEELVLEFRIHLSGSVVLSCDRCLEDFKYDLDTSYILYGKFGEGRSEEEFDVVWIPHGEHQVNLAQYLYEYVILGLPIKRMHPLLADGTTGCNADMIRMLEGMVIGDDEDSDEDQDFDEIDE